jgi:hypothetical protein
VRDLKTKVHMVKAESARALAFCDDVAIHAQSLAVLLGAAGGSADQQEKDLLQRHRKFIDEKMRDAEAVIARIPTLSRASYDDVSDVLARVDANLHAVRLSAADRERALYELIRMVQAEVNRKRDALMVVHAQLSCISSACRRSLRPCARDDCRSECRALELHRELTLWHALRNLVGGV